jgi:hypothetical protein
LRIEKVVAVSFTAEGWHSKNTSRQGRDVSSPEEILEWVAHKTFALGHCVTNSGQVPHNAKWKPWRLKTYVACSEAQKVLAF